MLLSRQTDFRWQSKTAALQSADFFTLKNTPTCLLVITKPQNQFWHYFSKNCSVVQLNPLPSPSRMLSRYPKKKKKKALFVSFIILEDTTPSPYVSHGSHSFRAVSLHPSSLCAGRTVLSFIFEGILRPLHCLPVTVTLSHRGPWLLHIQWFSFQHWVNRGCS